MAEEVSLLEKELADEPIIVPSSPFWDIFKDFGRDESSAFVANTATAQALTPFLRGSHNGYLALAAIAAEKVMFFPWHIRDAVRDYRSAPKDERGSFLGHLWKGLTEGGSSLAWDICVHDPTNWLMLYFGLDRYPDTPTWMLSALSFLVGVGLVSGLKIGKAEAAYAKRKYGFKRKGFGFEKYLESRFQISSEVDPLEVMEDVASKFELGEPSRWRYEDRYFETSLPEYSARAPKMRLRRRVDLEGKYDPVQTAQVVFTRAVESRGKGVDQYRYFPTRKDKLYFKLEQDMPESVDDVVDNGARRILRAAMRRGGRQWSFAFDRTVAFNPEKLLVSADYVKADRPFNVVELKVYRDTALLKSAIRHILRNYPVVQQTTHGKLDLVSRNGSAV